MAQAVVMARCVSCGAKRKIEPREVAAGDLPFCNECYSPMVAELAELEEGKEAGDG